MTRLVGHELRRTFRSLSVRNYRLFFSGQVVSMSGTWMQTLAQGWLVLTTLRGTAFDLGLVTAAQFVPMLVLGAWGGLIADRANKRHVLMGTQSCAGILALTLGVLTVTGEVRLWMVYVLAASLGLVTVVDNPSRQAFVHEMVGPDLLPNAVSLNSVVVSSARVIGPALAGVLIVTMGIGQCFLINAVSYVAVLIGLAMMRKSELRPLPAAARAKGQLRAGMRYVWSHPGLRRPLLMMVMVGTLAYEFQVTLPTMALHTFHGGAGVNGAMFSAMSAGAVVGGLAVASRGRPTHRMLTWAAVAFGLLIAGLALAPTLGFALAVLPLMGAASIAFIATANSSLQMASEPAMRGRVMSLYAVAFLGSTPIGAPIAGGLAHLFGPRVSLAVGALATLVAAGLWGAWRRAPEPGAERHSATEPGARHQGAPEPDAQWVPVPSCTALTSSSTTATSR